MPEKLITYCGQTAKVACDGKCEKAWGLNNRSKEQLSDDEDDYAFLADGELGIAPIYPGTFEGSDGKPLSVNQFPNKWCVRECERCTMSQPGEFNLPLEVRSFEKRFYNLRNNCSEKRE
jgi:hypothetical protein